MHGRKSTNQRWSDSKGRVSSRGDSLDTLCLKTVDASLAGVIVVVPFFFGGRHDLGRLLVILLCTTAAVAWFVGQAAKRRGIWTPTGGLWFFVASIAVVCIQLLPLPQDWIDTLAPSHAELLPLWSSDASHTISLGDWNTLSLYPEASKVALATLVAYALLFVTASQRIQSPRDVERILKWIALSATAMACFGLIQFFASNGKFFWFYEVPFTDTTSEVKGSFTCRNHFAHFLVLGLPAIAACLVSRLPDRRHLKSMRMTSQVAIPALLLAALVTAVAAVLLSLSRGGALALSTAAFVLAILYVRLRLISKSDCVLGVGAVVMAACVLLSVYGYDKVAMRLDDFSEASVESLDQNNGRRTIWAANWEVIQNNWQTGAGAGLHRYIYPAYLSDFLLKEYTHAENGYLQIVTENGLPGALLLAFALLCCIGWCVQAVRKASDPIRAACVGAVAAALAASSVHSLVDFVWFVPACMTHTILFAACAFRLSRSPESDEAKTVHVPTFSRPVWIGITAIASLGGLWAVGSMVGPAQASLAWDRYQLANSSFSAMATQRLLDGGSQKSETSEHDQMFVTSMIGDLQQVVRCHESDCRAHIRLATNYLREFSLKQTSAANQMSVSQIRDAAMASQFTSARQLKDWLEKALGNNSELLYRAYYHTRRAIQLCPLEGDAYVMLAELCFLEGKQNAAIGAYLDQAVKLRPRNDAVVFAVGMQWMTLGQAYQAFEYWKPLFQSQDSERLHVFNFLANQLPAEDILQLFQPDWNTVWIMWRHYHEAGSPQDQESIVRYARITAEQEVTRREPRRACFVWWGLASMQVALSQDQEAMESLGKAFDLDSDNLYVRGLLGQTLVRLGRPQEAEPHLRWCLARQPDNVAYRGALLEATKVRLGQAPTQQGSWH